MQGVRSVDRVCNVPELVQYKQPELIHRIHRDLADFNPRVLAAIGTVLTPDLSGPRSARPGTRQGDQRLQPYAAGLG